MNTSQGRTLLWKLVQIAVIGLSLMSIPSWGASPKTSHREPVRTELASDRWCRKQSGIALSRFLNSPSWQSPRCNQSLSYVVLHFETSASVALFKNSQNTFLYQRIGLKLASAHAPRHDFLLG